MARKIIDIGTIGNDGTGDSIRDSFRKVNDNFRELYSSLGLGERLTFVGLDDTPGSYTGQNDAVTGNTPIVTINNTESGVQFKRLVPGNGISLDFTSNDDEIAINSDFSEISADPTPQLGGNLSARSGGNQYRINDLADPITPGEAVRKAYADSKVSIAGVEAVDPASGIVNSAFGRMTGPLVLARDPEPDDDELYDGLVAATKRYVDNSAFGSSVNLYVATSGADERPEISSELQGRALAYAYRSIEAACRRAEEILLEARNELGPYKKILTYNNGATQCTLSSIGTSPSSGSGFAGSVFMSLDTLTLSAIGSNYFPGDILTINGGTVAAGGEPAKIEVLTTLSTPGAISTFRIVSVGVYSALPGTSNIGVTITTAGQPSIGAIGANAKFNLTYKVSSVSISSGGSGYSLVSVRIASSGGDDAFGTANVTGGVITGITITDQGGGFTSVPSITVDLPRFFIATAGFRTDFTGDVLTDTPEAIRGRDIREGLYLRGETSGALAQILAHDGTLDSEGNELFDVDIQYGTFQTGEVIAYGDVSKRVQISILVESGIYEENLPIKVPQNTSIVGDEFRRCIVRPKTGNSSSPWAFQKFRRDLTIDGLTTASQLYGYHYLTDPTEPVYPKIDNAGNRDAAATLISLNRQFIQNELIAWINAQIAGGIAPFTSSFEYDNALCKRDAGLIVDALVFDLKYGGYDRTISAALKYYESASARIAIGAQLSQTLASVDKIEEYIGSILTNTAITPLSQTVIPQVIDRAYTAESGAAGVISDLITALKDIMDESGPGYGSVNQPKANDELDVFLANDAVRWQAISVQGQGGFAMILDPTGQILAKSPYAQECASFSKSVDAQTFAGGMFIDGFAGNLQFTHESTVTSTRLTVGNLERLPKLPASFLVDDTVYRINYVRDFNYSPSGSTATFVLDETTPFTRTAGSQTITSISVANPAVITFENHRLQQGATVKFTTTGTLPTGLIAGKEYYVAGAITNDTFTVTATFGSSVLVQTTGAGSGTHKFQRIYEVLMPGNRSMLSNDYTQVNDMGYGIIATNGGLSELVSVFTYYCYASYYSLNGGQIRSVSGSSAHGIYALVAEGSDPLEIPTPTGLYFPLSQKVVCYAPSPAYANSSGGLFIYVDGYNYLPFNTSELEIDHGNLIYRYPITSVEAVEGLAGVARLNLTSDPTGNFQGLFDQVTDNTVMSIRCGSQIGLKGGLEDVAVRPSTGLVLNELTDVYRVLLFTASTDPNGPYEINVTVANPGVFNVLATVTDIATNVCTTSQNHRLVIGDKFIPTSTANGFTSGTTYYVISVPNYNQFTVSTSAGGATHTLSNGSGLTIKGKKTHKLLENTTIQFESTVTLPPPLNADDIFHVVGDGLTDVDFQVSTTRAGDPLEITGAGTGTHSYNIDGLTTTNIRENYNYVDITIKQPGEQVGYVDEVTALAGMTAIDSISIASPAVITVSAGHGLSAGDVVLFKTSLGGSLPAGLSTTSHFHVLSTGLTATQFRVALDPEALASSVAVDTSGSLTGTAYFGIPKGRVGDDTFAVVAVGPSDAQRIVETMFCFKGEEYVITAYESEAVTLEPYARITLDRPLVHSVQKYGSAVTLKSGVQSSTNGAEGTLTIRISLTRVTGHDLLEIGTGSYADTNYPNEIYGAPVNSPNPDTETEERDVGRVFYVTTDQFGNFSVGPYFRVDQGTGAVTFASSIALSNLDGIGFKRGVPVSEFSTDSSFSDNATDTVPTENAARGYIERRLGITHGGSVVTDSLLIPQISGGFMSLDGQLGMKANMNLNNNKITNLANPVNPLDGVNLRSMTFANFQEFTIDNLRAADIIAFTGAGNEAINVEIVGDISLNIDSTANTLDAQINPGVILNADVNASAGIVQSKLSMNAATTRASASGIAQADRGLASFDSAQFVATDGWLTVKDNGLVLTKLAQVTTKTVLGNSTLATGNVTAVPFSTVVNDGGAIKKSQYSTVGFLRRTNGSSFSSDGDYAVVQAVGAYGGAGDNSKLVIRDSSGDFGGNVISANQLKVDSYLSIDTAATASGGYVRYYGWQTAGGVVVGSGSLGSDKVTQYWNDAHQFKTQDGSTDAPITASAVQTLALTTGGNTTSGTITGRWTLTGTSPSESRLQATYSADLAEYYEGDKEYEVGTVLVFGGEKEVTTTNKQADTRVAGVVSNTAAFAMYEGCPGLKNLVALQGRVPVRVVGKIQKGDLIVTSSIPGVAVSARGTAQTGTVIGKALENYDSDHIGKIEVAVGRS